MARQNVTESEYELMKILWRAEKPMTIGDILKLLPENKWTRTTVSTLLVRLCDKNVIAYDSKGKYHYYYPVLKEKEYSVDESKSFLSKMFGGSLRNMVASLYENDALSREDIDELRKLLDTEK